MSKDSSKTPNPEPRVTLDVRILYNKGCCFLVSPEGQDCVGWVPSKVTEIDNPKQHKGKATITIPHSLAIKRGFIEYTEAHK